MENYQHCPTQLMAEIDEKLIESLSNETCAEGALRES
jgi:hypothetical protein